jgi:hypothetical protein
MNPRSGKILAAQRQNSKTRSKTRKRCIGTPPVRRPCVRCDPSHRLGPSPCRGGRGLAAPAGRRRRDAAAFAPALAPSLGGQTHNAAWSPWPSPALATPAARAKGSDDDNEQPWTEYRDWGLQPGIQIEAPTDRQTPSAKKPQNREVLGLFNFGRREWTRTIDPHHVKVVL